MRLLVTGAAGMLGRDVVAAAEAGGHDVVALARGDLDITNASAVRTAVGSARPDAVINCAAWTDVDGAETSEEMAHAVNGAGAGAVAAAAAAAGAHTVHVSSDYVFDGTAREPYSEDARTGPATAYGRSKLAGERAVAEASPRTAIVRSSWLFGVHGPNFVATMLSLASERDEVSVVDDQVGCPTFTGHLAGALIEIARRGGGTPRSSRAARGSRRRSARRWCARARTRSRSPPRRRAARPSSAAARSRSAPRQGGR